MFLEPFKMLKSKIYSSATRNTNYFYNKISLQNKIKYLSIKKKWNSGRNDKGRIVVWTKTSLLKKLKSIKINYNTRYRRLSFIATFQFIPLANKLLTLVYFSNGAVSYFIKTDNHRLFSYVYLNKIKKLRKLFDAPTWSLIFYLKKLIFISFIELSPGRGAQISLSSGTKSKLMVIDVLNKNALIQLPSKIKKNISYYSAVFMGQISLSEKKKFNNTKSGYWRSFGLKPIVRGVAMNAVDHPHGGRTKSVRYQRTPWGKTTKFK